jgi:hypothetical protein
LASAWKCFYLSKGLFQRLSHMRIA